MVVWMKDPKRLLDSEAGLAREILHMAASQPVPDASVAAVLRAVDQALEGKSPIGMDALIQESDPSKRTGRIARSLPSARRGIRFWAKFGLALEASTLIPAGAALAAVLGGSVIVGGLSGSAQSEVAEVAESAPEPAKVLAPTTAAVHVGGNEPRLAAEESSGGLLDAPGALQQNASVESRQARASAPHRLSPARAPLEKAATTETASFDDDWLGEQFALIAKARRNLDAGNSAEALEILDDYARRFPEGTLGHQAAALRERAGEATSREPRSGARLDFGI